TPRTPPTATLFPYTTLFRSHPAREWRQGLAPLHAGLQHGALVRHQRLRDHTPVVDGNRGAGVGGAQHGALEFQRAHAADGQMLRSEEHTSELQSLTNIVCRL